MTDESDFRYHFNCDHSHCTEIDNLMQSQMEQISAVAGPPGGGIGRIGSGSRRNRSRPRRSSRATGGGGAGPSDHAINISEPQRQANWENLHPSRRNSVVETGPGIIAGLDDCITQGKQRKTDINIKITSEYASPGFGGLRYMVLWRFWSFLPFWRLFANLVILETFWQFFGSF